MERRTTARNALPLSIIAGLASLLIIHVCGDHSQMRQFQAFKASLIGRHSVPDSAPSPSPSSALPAPRRSAVPPPRVYRATKYGADPTGKSDSTEALDRAIADAFRGPNEGFLMEGITNLGGSQLNLEGGDYLISKPLRMPAAGAGNLMVCSPKGNFPIN